MDNNETLKYSVAPGDNMEKPKEDFVAPSSEIDKTKNPTKTQKVTNISTLISQLEPSEPHEIFLVSKIPTDFSLLSLTVASVTPEIRIPY